MPATAMSMSTMGMFPASTHTTVTAVYTTPVRKRTCKFEGFFNFSGVLSRAFCFSWSRFSWRVSRFS